MCYHVVSCTIMITFDDCTSSASYLCGRVHQLVKDDQHVEDMEKDKRRQFRIDGEDNPHQSHWSGNEMVV